MTNDKFWENLYWTPELTRPDRLAKVLNSLVRKEDSDSEYFIYDRQAAKDAMKIDLTQHDISGVGLSRHDVDRKDLNQNNIDQFDSLRQRGDRAYLTHRDKQHLRKFDKLFHSHSRSSSSSNTERTNDNSNIALEILGLGKLGGGFKGGVHARSGSSDNRVDASDRQHEDVSDADVSSVLSRDPEKLHVLDTEQTHLNTTRIDTEQSAGTRIITNNLNQMDIDTNNYNSSKIDKDKHHTLSRHGVEKFLRELSNNVYLEDDIIKPRPVDAYVVKIGKLSTNTKLFSSTVLVRMRSNVHVLPLRCKPGDNGSKSKLWLSDRVEQIENILLNLSNHVSIIEFRKAIEILYLQM